MYQYPSFTWRQPYKSSNKIWPRPSVLFSRSVEKIHRAEWLLFRYCSRDFYTCSSRDSTIMDQSPVEKFTFVALFQTRQTNSHARIHLHLVILSLQPPTYNVRHVYTLFLQSFNIVWGRGGGSKATLFKTDNSAFLKLRFENTKKN